MIIARDVTVPLLGVVPDFYRVGQKSDTLLVFEFSPLDRYIIFALLIALLLYNFCSCE